MKNINNGKTDAAVIYCWYFIISAFEILFARLVQVYKF